MNPAILIATATFLAVIAAVLFIVFTGYGASDLVKNLQAAQSGIEKVPSPFLRRHLAGLFIHPRKFFSDRIALTRWPYLILLTWCYGASCVLSSIDRDVVRESRGGERPLWNVVGLMIGDSWSDFWVWILGLGAVVGLFLWLMGGWWYHLRLRWSGAKNPNQLTSHLLYVYSSFVASAPAVAIALLWTMTLPNYRNALAVGKGFYFVLVVFQFWSLVTSYIGAITLFELQRWKARIWFLGLPGLLYISILALAVLAAVFSRSHG